MLSRGAAKAQITSPQARPEASGRGASTRDRVTYISNKQGVKEAIAGQVAPKEVGSGPEATADRASRGKTYREGAAPERGINSFEEEAGAQEEVADETTAVAARG